VAKKVVDRKPVTKAVVTKKAVARKPVTKVAVTKKAVKPARPVAKRTAVKTPSAPVRLRAVEKPTGHAQQQPVAQTPVAETAAVDPFEAQPDATFDPTPDTNVPLRGHTSFQHNAQSERVAALKGQRARMSNRRKH